MSPSYKMPTGWRFCPEDTELIRDYLYNKVIQQQLPFEGVIVENDLYGNENPWEIWENFSDYVVKSVHCEDLYVFTRLKRKNAEAKNVERKVGLGSWEGEALAKQIIINNNYNNINQSVIIGFMKRFRFEKSGTYQDGKWIMHEYSLHPSLFPSNCLHMKGYVLCRIRKNDRTIKLQKRRKQPEENQQKYYEKQEDNQRKKKIRTETTDNIEKRICGGNKDRERIAPAESKEEETNMSMDDFSSWLEANLSSDDDPVEEKEGNSSRTNLCDDKYFNLSISNTLDDVELFVDKDTKSDDFSSWADKFFRLGEAEWQKMLV